MTAVAVFCVLAATPETWPKRPKTYVLILPTPVAPEILADPDTVILHVVGTQEGRFAFSYTNYYIGRFAYNVPRNYFRFEPVQPLNLWERKIVAEKNKDIQEALKSFREKGLIYTDASLPPADWRKPPPPDHRTAFFPERKAVQLLRNYFSYRRLTIQTPVGERYFEKRWSKERGSRWNGEVPFSYRYLDPENPDGEDWTREKYEDWEEKKEEKERGGKP